MANKKFFMEKYARNQRRIQRQFRKSRLNVPRFHRNRHTSIGPPQIVLPCIEALKQPTFLLRLHW